MKNRRASSSRLLTLTSELNSLSNEIEMLENDLAQPSSSEDDDESNEFIVTTYDDTHQSPYVGKADKNRLFKESIEILEKRTHQTTNLFQDDDEFPAPRKNIHIKNYKPPSERIDETIQKRNRLIQQANEEKEREFQETYTFKPKINPRNKNERYSTEHLIKPARRSQTPTTSQTPKRYINKNSERIADRAESIHGDDFLNRQLRRQRSASVAKSEIRTRKITPDEQRDIIENLSRPRRRSETTIIEERQETPRKRRSDPYTFERLVQQSFRRTAIEDELPEESLFKPVMNSRSRQMTMNRKTNLYEESLSSMSKRDKIAEEQRNWQEQQELSECTFKPKIIRRHPPPQLYERVTVPGMEGHVERLRKKREDDEKLAMEIMEEEYPSRSTYRSFVSKPFSFESRSGRRDIKQEREVDNILSEINKLLDL